MGQAKVLVVDDDELTAELVKECLLVEGYAVDTAADALAASRLLATERPDLVLLDLMLPGIDGWELCTLIRTLPDPELSRTPVIMLTSRSTEEDRLRGFRVGADDYITKPFTVEDLLLKTGRLLARQRRGDATPAGGGSPEGSLEGVFDMLHHELKNHLIAISGFARRIDTQLGTITRPALGRYVGIIRKSADHLNALLEDVLLFQALQTGRLKLSPEPTSLQDTVAEVISMSAPLAREKGIALRQEVSEKTPPVRFHPTAGKVCLSNLVENAIKYSPEGATVTVRLWGEEDGGVVLEVEDTGPGVPKEEWEKVFERFYRGGRTEKTTKGTGLGLYVVRSLAGSLGARVSLEQGEGAGSRFRLTFPAESTRVTAVTGKQVLG